MLSTTAAGTINQTARGFVSFLTKSASEEEPTALSSTSSCTDFRRPVEDHALMTSLEKPPRHVRAHSSKTNHADLHSVFLLRNRF